MFSNVRLVVLYGSQTGNAQDLAEQISRESKRFYFKPSVNSMDNYNVLELISEKCVVFVCSTTGQGEEPENMKQFWKFLLRKSLPNNSLAQLKYAVLGLGDSSYVKFNFVAKRLHKRLMQLGAQPLVPLGLGDDQHDLGYDAAADPWIETLWERLLSFYPLSHGVQPLDRNVQITPRWNVSKSGVSSITNPQPLYNVTRQPDDFPVTVLENSRTTHPDHFQDVRLIRLSSEAKYAPGDVLVLRPRNLPWQIDEFNAILQEHNLDFNQNSLEITENHEGVPVPAVLQQPLSFQQLCEEYFDLMAIPRRCTFQILSQITDSSLEREKCVEFTLAEGQDDLYTYCNRPKRNIVEVLRDFPHAAKNLTRDMLFEIFPAIKPREFSIASSCLWHQNEIHILLAVVRYKTKMQKERFGLCSNFLADLKVGQELTARIKKGSFRFPRDHSVPVVMVGPGTGVAPFRNFIFERVHALAATHKSLILFFGCRNRDRDFHCREDFEGLHEEGGLNLVTAFSRDQEAKVYVQDKILEHGELVWDVIRDQGYVFVAGSAKLMPQEVRRAIVDVCSIWGKMEKEDAERVVERMEKGNRYQTECWS